MKLGFKTGPKNWESEGQALAGSGAEACEVWFDVGREEEYGEMLAELTDKDVAIGLHHWGLVQGKYKTNLATQVDHIRWETIDQIKRTIDIGRSLDCTYVNVHPGARWLEELSFTPWRQKIVAGSETPPEESRELFLTAVEELQTYARDREVLLTVETLPALEVKDGHERREHVYNPESVPLDILEEMATSGGWLANDITHTAGQLMIKSTDTVAIWRELLAFTKRLAAQTKLLHMNTVMPPFNGTDSHDGVTDGDFERGAWPNRDQIKELLRIFTGREDVFVIPEPQEGTARENFEALQMIYQEIR